MPHPGNITAPVTLVSFGRSGSSLLADMFERHPDFSSAGETANLIYGTWRAVEASIPVMPLLAEDGRLVTNETRAARVVRQALLSAVPSPRPRWFQKPIGVPTGLPQLFGDNRWDEAAAWYWKVLRESFPEARYFTVLRNPFDVILSARAYWGFDEAALWWSLGFMSHLLAHPDSPVRYAVAYDDLVQRSRDAIGKLFEHLDVPFDERVMAAFSIIHAPAQGREKLAPDAMTRHQQWDALDPAAAKSRFIEPIRALFDKFGVRLEMPAHFAQGAFGSAVPGALPGVGPGEDDPTATTTGRLQQTVDTLNREIEQLHIKYRNDFHGEKEREYQETWLRQKAWIEQLEQANAWQVAENAGIVAESDKILGENARLRDKNTRLEGLLAAPSWRQLLGGAWRRLHR